MKDRVKQIINTLSPQDILELMRRLGVNDYDETEEYFIFPTICHNVNIDSASKKLYYYKKTKTFHCYTECGTTFTIFDLFVKYYDTRNIDYNWYTDVLDIIESKTSMVDFGFEMPYEPINQKYQINNRIIELPEYPKGILNVFSEYYCQEWIKEDITEDVMRRYNILYSISQNAIVIPHYDINNRLVGIRRRALNKEDAEKAKYMPIIIEGKVYSHPLSLNLYGLNNNIEAINNKKSIILFEAEKSVLKAASYYKDNNSVAVCGSNFNKMQLNLLLYKTNIKEVIIAFDKEYEKINSNEANKYFEKLEKLCKKYNKYYNFSFIFDKDNLIGYKDSPIDRGQEIFEELLKKRIVVN